MPATPDTLSGLLVQSTEDEIFQVFLGIAQEQQLPVTSWLPGDPTRSFAFLEARILATLETVVAGFVQSGFLDYAQGEWLTINAKQYFDVDVPAATFATTTVTLTNASGGFYNLGPGDLTVMNSTSGATYRTTTGGLLSNLGGTLDVTVVADVAGASGSSGAGEIDTLVTNLLGVTVANATAAVGLDVQSAMTTVQQCRNKWASLSPNGPAGAYSYVALNPDLTGIRTVTRCKIYGSSSTGDVTIYVAGPGGAISSGDVAAVQNAILQWATPLCITPTTISATPITFNVIYSIWLYTSVNQTSTQVQIAIQSALENFFAIRPIGGDLIPPSTVGAIFASMIESVIGAVFPLHTIRVSVTAPSVETNVLSAGEYAALGTVTGTVTPISGP